MSSVARASVVFLAVLFVSALLVSYDTGAGIFWVLLIGSYVTLHVCNALDRTSGRGKK